MDQITQEGLQVAQELGQRHGFSAGAVAHMMQTMLRSRGGMAQFNHPEFGGSGQWMPGGMLMISDMFNNALKARVDGLCRDVSAALAGQPMAAPGASHSFQQQSGGGFQQQSGGASPSGYPPMPAMAAMAAPSSAPLFVPDPRDTWWPAELGTPTATGEQNNVRYALFPDAGRLAVDINGQVSVYDTGGHQIAGFSQQQGGGGVVFSTPSGHVSLSSFSPSGGFGQQQQSGGGTQQQSSGGGSQQQSSAGGLHQQSSSSFASRQAAAMAPMTMAPMSMAPMAGMQPMAAMPAMQQQSWWPAELGEPASCGAQNDLRYATFPARGRLAVEHSGHCRVFDVGSETISGLSLNSASGELMLSTPEGERPLAQFPEVGVAAQPAPEPPPASEPTAASATPAAAPAASGSDDPYAALERLGELKAKGILTEEEFSRKKAELLDRL